MATCIDNRQAKPRVYGPYRRMAAIAQAVILLGLPFVTVNGQSALRFDVPSLRLHFFGAVIQMEEFFVAMAAALFIAFAFMFITFIFGRLWCGWACPQTVLSDLTAFIDGSKGVRKALYLLIIAALSALVAADLLWYLVSPYEFIDRLAEGRLGTLIGGAWLALGIIIFLDIAFLRRIFCRSVCPYAKLQGVLFDRRTMIVAFDTARKDECMKCAACVRVCPVGIDIRDGLQAQCISCTKCMDACHGRMERKGKPSLVNYFFGSPDDSGKPCGVRTGAMLSALGAAVFLLILIFSSASRQEAEFTIRANTAFETRIEDGAVTSAHYIKLRNLSADNIEVTVKSPGAGVLPDGTVALGPEEAREVPLYIRHPHAQGATGKVEFPVIVESTDGAFKIEGKAFYIIP